ncbi:LTA synthase family protein [Paenibacillus sp. 1001270B_150601_E10]|uniref:LTA synthase family protein n=1 Tax=Paenibacillus sp. 1001270B_150601_E10 TaxID=2787079 RepID=UPI00189E19F4|nr:LTA synthase family protein [Paenibacillus sp. 1001270B_150601_E10]
MRQPYRTSFAYSSGRPPSRWFTFGGLSYLLFIVFMLWKCLWLNHLLAIPNMATDRYDVMVNLGALLILGGLTMWLPSRWRPLVLFVMNLLLTFLLYADLVYFRYFQDFITIPVLQQTGQVGELGGSIAALLSWKDLYFFLDWLLLLPLCIREMRAIRRTSYLNSRASLHFHKPSWGLRFLRRSAAGLVSLAVGGMLLFYPIHHATTTWAKGLFDGNWWSASLYNITGIYGFHGYDIARYAEDHWLNNKRLSEDQVHQIEVWFEEHQDQLAGPKATFGKYKGSNVIMVQVEALENIVIGNKLNGQEITPHLNQLLKESLYFNRFYHQTGQGRTSDADFSVQSSLHPLPAGSVFTRYPKHQYDVLPTILKENHYTTGAYHAYEAGFWNRNIVYHEFNYDSFMSKKDYAMDDPLGWSLSDASFFRQSLERMKKEQAPFYSFMITLSSHHPYTMPKQLHKLSVDPYEGTIFGNYLQAVHYADEAIGSFIEELKESGLWDQSIFILYGDHDNSIPDKEPVEALLGQPISDLKMRETKQQVPLIIHLPDGAEAGTYDRVGGQMDVAPTILHWLGIDASKMHFMGSHLQNEQAPLVVLRDGSFTNGNITYLPSPDGIVENGTCYDVNTEDILSAAACSPLQQKASSELQISDWLITYNYLEIIAKK